MPRQLLLLVCPLFLLLGTSLADATVLWRGDFQTGDLSQWSSTETVNPDRLEIVTNPVFPGDTYALQVLVEPGDIVNNGNRAEVDYTGDSPQEGDERYYHWQTLFPSDFQAGDYWQIFTQWHQYITGGSPPLAMMVWGDQIKLGNEQNIYFWTAPLQVGEWHDYIVHVVWSTSASVGGVEVWYDGQHVLPFTPTATLFPNDTVFLKQGLYRSQSITWNQTLYQAGMTIATALSDVLPAAADAGEPADAGSVAEDAGAPEDAGMSPEDAGTVADAGELPDAGPPAPPLDAGAALADGGASGSGGGTEGGGTAGEPAKSPPAMQARAGCASTAEVWSLSLVVAGAALALRRRLRARRG